MTSYPNGRDTGVDKDIGNASLPLKSFVLLHIRIVQKVSGKCDRQHAWSKASEYDHEFTTTRDGDWFARLQATRAPLGEVTNSANGKETPAKTCEHAQGTETGDEVEKIDLTKTPDVSKTSPKTDTPTSNSSKKRLRSTTDDGDTEKAEKRAKMSSIDLDGAMIDQNADQVRRKLRRIADNKEMTVKALCETLQVSSTSYSNFMRQSGPTKGTGSDVFMNAWEYLTKREMVGIKLPVVKKAKKDSKATTAKGKGDADIPDVHLDGEERDAVPVYMTCDAVRRQITAHLKATGTSQAQFCRDLSAQLHTNAAIKPNTLATFRGKHGANAGATSKVFYAAYVLFEKQRVQEGKAKSKVRQEMEGVWGSKGMDLDHDASTG